MSYPNYDNVNADVPLYRIAVALERIADALETHPEETAEEVKSSDPFREFFDGVMKELKSKGWPSK